jgi:predicted Rossmann-fold nucleotide-binding protein
MVETGTISPQDVDLLTVTDDIGTVIAEIQAAESSRQAGEGGGGMRSPRYDPPPLISGPVDD